MFKYLVAIAIFLQVQIYETALIANFSQGPPIYGVVNDKDGNIYVIKDSQSVLNVYRSDTYELKLNASLPSVAGPYDMVYSKIGNNLLVLDWTRSEDVLRIRLDRLFESSSWKFTTVFTSASLSITPNQNIIITMSSSAKFGEYTNDGSLIKLVTLQNISQPRQVIKINSNKYAVCFGYDQDKPHGVCLVDGNGKTVKCLAGLPGSNLDQFNVPARMILTTKGCILVADMNNGRIVELSSDLTRVKIILSQADGLTKPYRIKLGDKQKKIFIANNQLDPTTGYAVSGHILVFDYKE